MLACPASSLMVEAIVWKRGGSVAVSAIVLS
jgi:hypothetical protein